MNHLKQFVEKVNKYDAAVNSSTEKKNNLKEEQDKLVEGVASEIVAISKDLDQSNPFKHAIQKVEEIVQRIVKEVQIETDKLYERIRFKEMFNERLILIVYGKVNSGKSSFVNYFTEVMVSETNYKPTRFEIDRGKKNDYLGKELSEGPTETTDKIQGVEIGKFVILDSPGLHSVTEENGKLAKHFTDSADLVLWITSSGSPGQLQELEALKSEINKRKTVIPVISKSDKYEEDEDNGELVKILKMKDDYSRDAQRKDVFERGEDLLRKKGINTNILNYPVSLSVKYSKSFDQNDNFDESGFSELFKKLNENYEHAIHDKINNIANQTENHSQKIIDLFRNEACQPLNQIMSDIEKKKSEIEVTVSRISEKLINEVSGKVPALVNEAQESRDTDQLAAKVNQNVDEVLDRLMREEFEIFFMNVIDRAASKTSLSVNISSDYKDITFEYTQTSGSATNKLGGGVGSLIGSAIGTFFGPGGVVVGGVVGGFAGNAGAKAAFEKKEIVQKNIGVDSSNVEYEVLDSLKENVPQIVKGVNNELLNQLVPLEVKIKTIVSAIEDFEFNHGVG